MGVADHDKKRDKLLQKAEEEGMVDDDSDEDMEYDSEEDQHPYYRNDNDNEITLDSDESDIEIAEIWHSEEEATSEEDIEPVPHCNTNRDFFSLNVERDGLNEPLVAHGKIHQYEKLLMEIATTLRHRQSYLSMLASFKVANLHYDNVSFPTTMVEFWKLVNCNFDNFKRSITCRICWDDLGTDEKPSRVCRCTRTGPTKLKYMGIFLYSNLPAQLQELLGKRGMASSLEYPWTRVKRNPDAIEDVYDGSVYRGLSTDGGFLCRDSHNYSLAIWTDIINPFPSAPVNIWPVYVQVLELSPQVRQRNSLLAALYVGPEKPQVEKFLAPFVMELRNLYLNGITWRPDGVAEVTSRFTTLIVAADSDVRHIIMGMNFHDSHNGCTFCYARGERIEQVHNFHIYRYRDGDPGNNEDFARDRTDAEIRRDAEVANRRGFPEHGVQALSVFSAVPGLDLRNCQLVEALHCLWQRNMPQIYSILTSSDTENYITPVKIREISKRIEKVKPPTKLASYPQPLKNIATGHYKGTEYRNLAWYYWLPCAHDHMTPQQIEYCSLFIDATYILNKDSIRPEELDYVDHKIDAFRRQTEEMFPAQYLTYSIHLLKHIVRCVRELGPLWVASGFGFECLNRQIRNCITNPIDHPMQIARRILLTQKVEKGLNLNMSPDVRNLLRELLHKAQGVVAPDETEQFNRHNRAVSRYLNQKEIVALVEAGYQGINKVTRHPKVYIDGVYYQPHSDNSVNYDNSVVLVTLPNVGNCTEFIRIMSIISWLDGNDKMKGVIGRRFITVGDAFNTSYMKIVQESQALIYLPLRCLNAPAVLVKSAGQIYVSPIPNRWDVD